MILESGEGKSWLYALIVVEVLCNMLSLGSQQASHGTSFPFFAHVFHLSSFISLIIYFIVVGWVTTIESPLLYVFVFFRIGNKPTIFFCKRSVVFVCIEETTVGRSFALQQYVSSFFFGR